jgi:hypothetical protein
MSTGAPTQSVVSAPASDPLTDAERERVFLENIENKLNTSLGPLASDVARVVTFMEGAGPAIESLKTSNRQLSDDFKDLTLASKHIVEDQRRLAGQATMAAASSREMAEHVGVLIGHMSRLDGRLTATEAGQTATNNKIVDLERGQKAAVEATDKELATLRKATAENRQRIIEIVKDDPRITTPDEITAIRRLPPVATALEQQLLQISVERAKAELTLEQERKKDELETKRARDKQTTLALGKVIKISAQVFGILALAAALWAAGHYFGLKQAQETTEHRR